MQSLEKAIRRDKKHIKERYGIKQHGRNIGIQYRNIILKKVGS